MASLVLAPDATFDPDRFAAWLDEQATIGPKWRPRYLRLLADPPTTGTNKIVKRTLVHQKWRTDRVGGDPVYVRGRGEATYQRFRADDETALLESFRHHGRTRFVDP